MNNNFVFEVAAICLVATFCIKKQKRHKQLSRQQVKANIGHVTKIKKVQVQICSML